MKRNWLTPIVKRALVESITNLGQLSHQEKLELEYAVRHGFLSKGQGGPFPKLKTVYAHPGFDFAADREAHQAEMLRARMIDIYRGVAHFFPWVPFQQITR